MRKLVFHMQTTLDGRIATADGTFWEPFPMGEAEQRWINAAFASVDTWVLGRVAYEVVIPFWQAVGRGETPAGAAELTGADREFGALVAGMTTVAISASLPPAPDRSVIGGDVAQAVAELKAGPGDGVIALSGGPATVGPLFDAGLVDEVLVVLNPKVLAAGPRWTDGLTRDLTLTLLDATPLGNGAVAVRHAVS